MDKPHKTRRDIVDKLDPVDRIRTAVESDPRFDARKISEILKAFHAIVSPVRIAEIMAEAIDAPDTSPKVRERYLAFYLNIKKFEEKNEPKITDEEIDKLTTEQSWGLIREKFIPQLANMDKMFRQNEQLKKQVEELERELSTLREEKNGNGTKSTQPDGTVCPAI